MGRQDVKRLYSIGFQHGSAGNEHYAAWLTFAEVGRLEDLLRSAPGIRNVSIQCLYLAQTLRQLEKLIKCDLEEDNTLEEEIVALSREGETGWWNDIEEDTAPDS